MKNPRKYLSNVKILNNNIEISYRISHKITDWNKSNYLNNIKDKD